MLNESTTDGVSIHESFLRGVGCPVHGLSFASLDLGAAPVHGVVEGGALGVGDRGPLVPEGVGRGTGGAFGSSGGVGFRLSEGQVVRGPVGRVAVGLGVTIGARFQRADARFDGPVVP